MNFQTNTTSTSSIKLLSDLFQARRYGRVYGGRFADIANHDTLPGDVTIRLAHELAQHRSTISIETHDFNTPPDEQAVRYALLVAVRALSDGHNVYCGCAGGIGRTGLFLALLVAALRTKCRNPVKFVRENYNKGAVETPKQLAYLDSFIRRNQPFFAELRAMMHRTNLQITSNRRPPRSTKQHTKHPVKISSPPKHSSLT